MKVKLNWRPSFNSFRPECISLKKENLISYLCTFLADDGGLGWENTIRIVDKVFAEIALLKSGEKKDFYEDRET